MFSGYIIIFISSFLVTIPLIVLARKYALSRAILLLKNKMALVGGVGIGLSFMFNSFFWSKIYKEPGDELGAIVVSSLVVLLLGVFDDLKEFSVKVKFLVQFIATLILIYFGVHTKIIYIGPVWNIAITLIWVIGVTNAYNHLDIIDGLCGGITVITSLALAVISLIKMQYIPFFLSLSLCGATSAFLLFNWPPARLYMGNSGSHFVGFVLAALALIINYAPIERKMAIFAPLIILGLPVLDTLFLIIVRLANNKSVFKKSDDHLALRLIKIGFSKTKALHTLLLSSLFLSFLGVFVVLVPSFWGAIIIILVMLSFLLLTRKMIKVNIND
ncbi:MAG: MraY family glycosyltransferase [Candidatus Omnitrophota bacterium]|nr:undecaprenyl/decaprenyl-phosphate alpha-N-acetylglucosaminyl 1-phosphate transferase [Candidatus Omnitrophota bacterium]